MGKWISKYVLGEKILDCYANSGGVILIRSLWLTTLIYIPLVIVVAGLQPNAIWGTFNLPKATAIALKTLPWLGAIFTVVYASLYARFSSQWNYLAALYNQLMQASVEHPPQEEPASCEHTKRFRIWQAAFVEDAEELHLAAKPVFASAIRDILRHSAVRECFVEHHKDGPPALVRLEKRLAKAGFPSRYVPAASEAKPIAAPAVSCSLEPATGVKTA